MDGDFSAAVDRLRAAVADLHTAPLDDLTDPQVVAELDRIKHAVWAVPAVEHRLTARLIDADPHALGATSIREVLANHLRITPTDARNRITDATQLGPRYTIHGERVQTELAHTADAVARGDIGAAHVRVIQDFIRKLPVWVSATRRDDYERDLVTHALQLRPDQFKQVADTLLGFIDQDGTEPDHQTLRRRRHLRVGRQQADGMSRIEGWLTPEARALWDVIAAKYAAPGQNLPHDDAVTGRDDRTPGQRHHDALTRAMGDAIASGTLAQVAGVPAGIVATATLSELERAAGWAHTGGGNRIPMRDLIRLAGHSRHYLAVFDDHTEEILYLGRAKRCASTPNASPCSPGIVAAPTPTAPCRSTGPKPTTPTTTPKAAAPTSTPKPWPANPPTCSSRKPDGPPCAPATAAPTGSHPNTTTPANRESTTTSTRSATSPTPTTRAGTTERPRS
nr:DUF222 domain-containing protein [Mycobacterium sp. IS-1742]